MAYGDWVFWYLLMLLALISVAAWLERKKLAKAAPKKYKTLLIIFVVALLIRMLLPHFHYMFIDENWYLEAAKSMSEQHKPLICENMGCEPFKKSPGWSFMLAVLFMATGPSQGAAFVLSSILGALSVFPMYLIARHYMNHKSGIIAAGLLAINPLHVLWSLTTEQITAPLFFLLLVFALMISGAYLAGSVVLAFALHMRAEFILLLPVVLLIKIPWKYWIIIAAGVIIDIPHLLMLNSLQEDIYRAPYFTFSSLASNFFPAILIVTGFLFLAVPVIFSRKFPKPLVLWPLLFTLLYMSFSRMQDRMLIFPMAGVLILASFGLSKWKYGLHATVLLSLPMSIPLITADYSNSVLQTEVPGLIDVPDGCTVFAEYATVLALNQENRASSIWLKKGYLPRCSYFLADGFCHGHIKPNPGAVYNCPYILESFDLELVERYKNEEKEYQLYRIN